MRWLPLVIALALAALYKCYEPDPYYYMSTLPLMLPPTIAYTALYHAYLEVVPGAKAKLEAPPLAISQSRAGKLAVVTGANTGIGFETAKSLVVDHGMTVVLACRTARKGETAADTINALVEPGQPGKAVFLPLDLSRLASVREFANRLKTTFPNTPVQVLVNNAGSNHSGNSHGKLGTTVDHADFLTEDGFNRLVQVNWLGHYLLTSELLSSMAHKGRVINLSSTLHHFFGDYGAMDQVEDWKEFTSGKMLSSNVEMHDLGSYIMTKVALLLMSAELNKRYPGRIESIAVNPGGVKSDIWRTMPSTMDPVLKILFMSQEDGSKCSVAASVVDFPHNFQDDASPKQEYTPPYLQPYPLPYYDEVIFPIFESMGPFAGPLFSTPRMPENPEAVGAAMWQAGLEMTGAQWMIDGNDDHSSVLDNQ